MNSLYLFRSATYKILGVLLIGANLNNKSLLTGENDNYDVLD